MSDHDHGVGYFDAAAATAAERERERVHVDVGMLVDLVQDTEQLLEPWFGIANFLRNILVWRNPGLTLFFFFLLLALCAYPGELL